MPQDRFLIAPYNSGLVKNNDPWIIPDDAFEEINNAYVWRNRVKKRPGATVMNPGLDPDLQQTGTRLRLQHGDTNAHCYITGVLPIAESTLGQMISVDNVYMTVVSNAAGYQNMLSTVNANHNIAVGNILGDGTYNGIVPGPFAIGQAFRIIDGANNPIFVINSLAAGPQPLIRYPGGGGVHTLDVTTGIITLTAETPGAPIFFYPNGIARYNFATRGFIITVPTQAIVPVFFYPGLPVMGFATYERGEINDDETIAFDTRFAYRYTGNGWARVGNDSWTGNDLDYFWSCSWRGAESFDYALFTTNNVRADHIKYLIGNVWADLYPIVWQQGGQTARMETAKIVLNFKDRIVALNTTESINGAAFTIYNNRARFSRIGDPVNNNNSWRIDIPGRGYYIDAPTKESIVTATIIHDRLIVYFESSTYELVYTGNQSYPFVWQLLNANLGTQSTHSIINFDNQVFGIGATGIHTCNGNSVARIDGSIPDETFKLYSTPIGIRRVAGIREFHEDMIYWSVPYNPNMQFEDVSFPNKVLVYNYENKTYAYLDDCITAYGYYEQQDGLTWERITSEWQHTHFTWDSGEMHSHPRQVVAGNHHGWTFIVQSNKSKNSMSMSITNFDPATRIVTCYRHNLPQTSYIYIENCVGVTEYNDHIVQASVIDQDHFYINSTIIPGVGPYLGGGTITRVSQISFFTKQFNFYIKENRNAAISKIDFLVGNYPDGRIAVEYYPSYSKEELQAQANVNNCALGNNILELTPYATVPLENAQEKFWHCLYFMGEGSSVQFELFYNREQMLNRDQAFAGFELHAMAIYAQPTSQTTR